MRTILNYFYVDSSGEVVSAGNTTDLAAAIASLPSACTMIEGIARPNLDLVEYDGNGDPVIRPKTASEILVDERQIKEARDRLELSPVTVSGVPYDVDDKSLKRMAGAIANWDDLSLTVTNGKIGWIVADNTIELLTKAELETVKAAVDIEMAKRSDRLFYHFVTLAAQLPNVSQADIADENWPVDA